ncbi:hypothetical protein N9R43_01245 [bacterium]|nr:hypothetical protein [bacterium]
MLKAKNVDYRVTRNAADTELQDDDFAFVFNSNGDIRAIQLNADLEDNDELPYAVDKIIQLISELELITKLERTYH